MGSQADLPAVQDRLKSRLVLACQWKAIFVFESEIKHLDVSDKFDEVRMNKPQTLGVS